MGVIWDDFEYYKYWDFLLDDDAVFQLVGHPWSSDGQNDDSPEWFTIERSSENQTGEFGYGLTLEEVKELVEEAFG